MTHETQSRILALHLRAVEPGSVWIDPRAEIRVTLHAVSLLMAARARVQILTRRASMLKKPKGLSIVEHRAPSVSLRGEAELAVTRTTEGLRRVARSAIGLSAVRLRRVRVQEVRWMIPPGHAFATVTVRTEALRVATRALQLTGRSDGIVHS